ncbi:MAG: 30S ribosomal protein S3ae [Thaumarchaeota archaeon]|nr:30S ribosomal protein S3ae [Candidatus Calditenuaceae archaeon]MDW8186485.1 30S ribosomal protein S3ae [Nitrososphaerota archaeon]
MPEEKTKGEFVIRAPKYFGERELGYTYADDPNKLTGRTVTVSLYNLTDDLTKQYMLVKFKVVRINGRYAETVFCGHEYGREYLRSLIRRGTTMVDGVFDVITKDGFRFRVYGVVFTHKRIRCGKIEDVRRIMGSVFEEAASRLNHDQFAIEMVLGKMGSDVFNQVKRILIPRHVGVYKSKVFVLPEWVYTSSEPPTQAVEVVRS